MNNSNPFSSSRRDFMVALPTTGFALAVRPVSAQTITVGADAILTQGARIH